MDYTRYELTPTLPMQHPCLVITQKILLASAKHPSINCTIPTIQTITASPINTPIPNPVPSVGNQHTYLDVNTWHSYSNPESHRAQLAIPTLPRNLSNFWRLKSAGQPLQGPQDACGFFVFFFRTSGKP